MMEDVLQLLSPYCDGHTSQSGHDVQRGGSSLLQQETQVSGTSGKKTRPSSGARNPHGVVFGGRLHIQKSGEHVHERARSRRHASRQLTLLPAMRETVHHRIALYVVECHDSMHAGVLVPDGVAF